MSTAIVSSLREDFSLTTSSRIFSACTQVSRARPKSSSPSPAALWTADNLSPKSWTCDVVKWVTLLQCVTKPKIWTKPNPKLFSDTKFFRYRIRYFFRYRFFSDTDTDTFFDTKILRNRYQYFFRYQNFSKPIPILFSIPIFFETDTDTFFETKNFRNRYRYHPNNWNSFETEKFRNRNVTLWY